MSTDSQCPNPYCRELGFRCVVCHGTKIALCRWCDVPYSEGDTFNDERGYVECVDCVIDGEEVRAAAAEVGS